jgi:carbon monoxide dehydrogenase subunit G
MPIEIRERFCIQAPVDAVWQFVMDPHRVVTCMPGAQLEEVVDERTFLGSVRVKVGAIAATYRGRVQLVEVDAAGHSVRMVAEGRETGGGQARGTMASSLRPAPAGGTEVVAEATIDLTGRVVQVGRGMIEGVAQQLFRQFTAALKERLEATGAAEEAPPAAASPPPALRLAPLLFRALWESLLRLLRRLLRWN